MPSIRCWPTLSCATRGITSSRPLPMTALSASSRRWTTGIPTSRASSGSTRSASPPPGSIAASERRLLQKTLEHARALGCVNAWVLTEPDNARALGLYRKVGGASPEPTSVMFSFELTGDA